jgi:signal transduction histidine kinase
MAMRPNVRQLIVDWAPSVVLAALAGHELLYNHSGPRDWLLGQGLVWLLVLRRRAPAAVLGTTLLLGSVGWLAHVLLLADLGILVALHAVVLLRTRAYAFTGAVLVEAAAVLVSFEFAPTGSVNDAVILLTGLTMSALLLGTAQRAQAQYLTALEERAGQLERERRNKEAIAAAQERTRIAREMHDIVAHSVSVMIALSEGAAATPDPVQSRSSMREVAATGRHALDELRRVLSVLHAPGDGAGRSPQPSLRSLADLVRDVRRAGLDVELRVEPGAERLSEALQATVFRIVQESLTNTLKHAEQATRSVVAVHLNEGEVLVQVSDDGGPQRASSSGDLGNGTRGMRERAEAFGGHLTSAPGKGGWVVKGTLSSTVGAGSS